MSDEVPTTPENDEPRPPVGPNDTVPFEGEDSDAQSSS